jgi:hypothetical protein
MCHIREHLHSGNYKRSENLTAFTRFDDPFNECVLIKVCCEEHEQLAPWLYRKQERCSAIFLRQTGIAEASGKLLVSLLAYT